jgi:hypothetical protein
MVKHTLMVVALVLSLAGCAAMNASERGGISGAPPETFAHRVATSEVVLLYNCLQPEPGRQRVEGLMQNPWQAQPIRYPEFELVGVDAQERTTARSAGAARDLQIFTNQSTPFQLELKTSGTEVRLDLYYQYRFLEGIEMDARLAGPPMAAPRLLAQTNTFLVRDACGASQHRAR